MSDAFLTAIEQQRNLLFITSAQAMNGFSDDVDDVQFTDKVVERLGDRLQYIPADAENADEATAMVPDWLEDDTIEGVVILGNYDTVPSRRMLCIDDKLMYQLTGSDSRPGEDRDDWWVWNDDIYASRSPLKLADLPVSRLPIIPRHLNSPFVAGSLTTATCVYGPEFPVVDEIFSNHLPQDGNRLGSPPFAVRGHDDNPYNAVEEAHLMVDKLYIMLHGEPRTTIMCWGTQAGSWNPIAIDSRLFTNDWQIGGVVFAGACWGVQMIDKTAKEVESGVAFTSLDIGQSLPLEFVNRGANAFVGFTALHHVPDAPETDLILGAPLHQMFWQNVTSGTMGPAEALFQAKAGYVSEMEPNGMHRLAIAEELKALWSASCVGFGW